MRAAVLFPDAAAHTAGYLRTALAARPEPYAVGATVGTRIPAARSPESPHLPFVLVALDDAVPDPSRLNSRALLRITVWHADPDQAHDLAQLVAALLHALADPVVRSTRPGVGPLPAVDPDSGVDLTTLTVTANIAPAPLT